MDWFILALRNTLNFKDRARRREYGWFLIGNFVINFFLGFIEAGSDRLGLEGFSLFIGVVSLIVAIPLFVASVSVTARRLHDLGYSGWWQLGVLGILLLVLLMLFALIDFMPKSAIITGILLCVAAYFIFGLWLLFKDGQRFTNRYGLDPKAETVPHAEIVSDEKQNENKLVKF
ncbi:membrane protein [Bibersteinia trehalosi Y31]|uniref:Membrane protein n=1 Tax=Bibersteinia trehalosi Y31 TaxID=1261658 RepID=A0A179CX88_BIBTR|nr:DUF805 domain-containing protein [Bibersteinia trehalosi]OAQ14412.1 membrane protein [Bibersteinia trehalosi Y31]